MNKTAAAHWYKLASDALEEGIKEANAEALLHKILATGGGGLAGGTFGGLTGGASGMLAGVPIGGMLGLLQKPEEGQSKWDLIKKRLMQGGAYGGAIGGLTGAGTGALSGGALGLMKS